jgi:hypothetical protein
MHLEVLVEDRSGGTVADALLQRLLVAGVHTFAIRPHRGKGEFPRDPLGQPDRMSAGLLDLLPAKLRAYAAVLDPSSNLVVVLMDSDEEDPATLRADLDRLCDRFAPGLPRVVALSTEEIEAWLLGDPEALLAAYPDADRKTLAEYRQDSVCGTWEHLARVLLREQAPALIRSGYPLVGIRKHEWADAISPQLDPARNRSPSFRRFSADLAGALEADP